MNIYHFEAYMFMGMDRCWWEGWKWREREEIRGRICGERCGCCKADERNWVRKAADQDGRKSMSEAVGRT